MQAAKTAVQFSLRHYQTLQRQQHDLSSSTPAAAPPDPYGAGTGYYQPQQHVPDTPQPSYGPNATLYVGAPPPGVAEQRPIASGPGLPPTPAELQVKELHSQAATLVADLKLLRRQVADIGRRARRRRGRRWLAGGFIAAFIPLLKALLARLRPWDDGEQTQVQVLRRTNGTEHAFWESRSLSARLLAGLSGYGTRIAAVAMFILGALHVFQNEVVLAAARSLMRRLKVLSKKVEEGSEDVSDRDMDVLTGWRWRVIFWEQK